MRRSGPGENPELKGTNMHGKARLQIRKWKRRNIPHNPGLAGFTTESDASGTFCQIIKELVDNAVDALEGGGNVQIKVVPSSSASKILRLTVTDDGVGMEDPFSFANAFNSSKGQAAKERIKRAREGEDEDEGDSVMKYMRKSKSGKSWVCTLCKKKCLNEGTMRKHGKECQVGVEFEDHGDLDDDEFGLYVKDIGAYEASRWASSPGAQTAGRFGVGLTLCILHSFVGTGGRTVIRSTKRGSDVERVCALVADVGGDKIVEVGEGVGREVRSDVEARGTTVSMLLPKGDHESAFPRIAEYLSRFHLLSGKAAANFSLSFVAPTLSPMELLVKPKESLVDGVRAYLNKKDLEESHVASKSAIVGFHGSEITVQVTLVFEGTEEEDGWGEGREGSEGNCDGSEGSGEDSDSDSDSGEDEGEENPTSGSNRRSTLSLVRIYNNSAMLDSIEGLACGIVAAIPLCPAWKKYGLKVEGSAVGVRGLDIPTFTVKDSELAWQGGAGEGVHQLLTGESSAVI
ncbi:hypothetical protein TrRE_jg11393 [Triparma retinervis]|uniref:Histidine kinase/HSP90-like ATPase domain-containing protein n=1 Tax=Triparma retinervis TaxID=2557542 RepID=A0A9W7C3Y6_9STRA|nr:hypothetical protein TrRE_jg11393 [Triparma retinervis]